MKKETKLFIVVDRGLIRAITEEKKIANRFVEERSNSQLYVEKITKGKIINKILLENEDLYITEEPILGILITEKESKYFVDEIYHEISRLRSTLRDMMLIRDKYNLPEDIHKDIEKGIRGLQKASKANILGEVFGLHILSKALISSHNPLEKYMKF